jgi:hypothetical protein
MKKKINNYLSFYLLILISFSYFFLYIKHNVGNDSTISEWLINYEGGFTKRGLVGQLAIEFSRIFELKLRWVIFLLQSLACTIYFFFLYKLLGNLKIERITVLSVFTPIFILYPIAEIEVLARKEILVFSLFMSYLFIPRKSIFKMFSFIIFTTFSILIWEPIIFFFPLVLIFEIIENKIERFNFDLLRIILSFIPSLVVVYFIIFFPLTTNEHNTMAFILKEEFGENCYMSCALLKSKSSIFQQFQGNFGKYSLEIFIRYFLIHVIGFFPIIILLKNSTLKNKNLLLFKFFNKPIFIFLASLLPVIILFAMGYDWGRWVNITYVMLALIYFHLLLNNNLILNLEKLENNFIYKIKRKFFIIFFVIFCFGWNPKTVITGDIGSFPGYRIPYKVFKILSN